MGRLTDDVGRWPRTYNQTLPKRQAEPDLLPILRPIPVEIPN